MTAPDFEKAGGLVPVIVQDVATQEVLMLAYMNRDAWEKTVETGKATYWSRSRKQLWVKGETSGNVQQVREIRIDCDSDAVLLLLISREQPVTRGTGPVFSAGSRKDGLILSENVSLIRRLCTRNEYSEAGHSERKPRGKHG